MGLRWALLFVLGGGFLKLEGTPELPRPSFLVQIKIIYIYILYIYKRLIILGMAFFFFKPHYTSLSTSTNHERSGIRDAEDVNQHQGHHHDERT